MTSYPVRPQNLPSIGPSMTSLSRRHAAEPLNISNLTGLARLSLVTCGIMAFGTTGCLITDKPDFDAPRQSPPFLANLDPPPHEILVIRRKPGTSAPMNEYLEDQEIRFTVHSDDLQQLLFFVVFIGPPGKHQYFPYCFFPPTAGTLRVPRDQRCPLTVPSSVGPGCHPITALASHDNSIYTMPKTDQNVGIATWWAQVGVDDSDPESDPDKYKPCLPNPPSGDAGADARDGSGS
jgi:hypothetical protein